MTPAPPLLPVVIVVILIACCIENTRVRLVVCAGTCCTPSDHRIRPFHLEALSHIVLHFHQVFTMVLQLPDSVLDHLVLLVCFDDPIQYLIIIETVMMNVCNVFILVQIRA